MSNLRVAAGREGDDALRPTGATLTTDVLAAPQAGYPAGPDAEKRAMPAFFVLRWKPSRQQTVAFVTEGDLLLERGIFLARQLLSMSAIILDVLPIFVMILIGWLIVRTGLMTSDVGDALSDFVFKIAVPLLLFRTIAEADFHGASPFRLWIAYFSGVAITWTAGHIAATRFFGRDERIGVLAGVSSAFANTIFIGLPLVERTVGNEGLVALSILIAVHLPVMMIVGTIMMERAEHKIAGKSERSVMTVLRQIGTNLVRNPLVIGLVAGAAMHLTGLKMPGPIQSIVDQIAGVAGPVALISLGMALRRYGISGNVGIASVTSAFKLLLLPSCVWMASHLLGLTADWTAALVLISSVPTGVNAWLIANRFGVGHSLAASTITVTTALGAISVSFWAYLLGA
jgi:predicted permease